MKYVDEFRDPQLLQKTAHEIIRLADDKHFRIMEVCGGHTHAIYRFGLEQMLPPGIELIHGPGCPVCVLPMGRVDDGLAIARDPKVILTAYGDMMRVPGEHGSPLEMKARGADIRMVYSPLDALKVARQNPDREVVFFAIGFETTAPATALTIMQARSLGIKNFSVFCNHIRIVPALRAILDQPDMRLDAFIGPGHVATVSGARIYVEVAEDYHKPFVVSGFEPLDIMQSILMLLKQLQSGQALVENQYNRVVPWEGNPAALRTIDEVFELRPLFEWRGLGNIPHSAHKLNGKYAEFDAETRYDVPGLHVVEHVDAQCGEVLKGALKPHQCKLFGKECTPERPIGALMVSSEGSCAAYFNYVHSKQAAVSGA
jgi:hydrogenase expression/formation protein HypD